jgi:hypothetical protein
MIKAQQEQGFEEWWADNGTRFEHAQGACQAAFHDAWMYCYAQMAFKDGWVGTYAEMAAKEVDRIERMEAVVAAAVSLVDGGRNDDPGRAFAIRTVPSGDFLNLGEAVDDYRQSRDAAPQYQRPSVAPSTNEYGVHGADK